MKFKAIKPLGMLSNVKIHPEIAIARSLHPYIACLGQTILLNSYNFFLKKLTVQSYLINAAAEDSNPAFWRPAGLYR